MLCVYVCVCEFACLSVFLELHTVEMNEANRGHEHIGHKNKRSVVQEFLSPFTATL